MKLIKPSFFMMENNSAEQVYLQRYWLSNKNNQIQSAKFDQNFNNKKQFSKNNIQILFIYLYFIHGFVISLANTMPFIYRQLPNYHILTYFNAAIIPYSLKFITAPFLQKYSNINYGKRKFWIVITHLIVSITILVSSLYTDQNSQNVFAFLLFISIFFLSLQDICIDSLIRKELKIPHTVSSLSTTSKIIGGIIGSIILLKLTSFQFAYNWFSLKQPIISQKTLIQFFGLIIIIPAIFIHFIFNQSKLRFENQSMQYSLSKIFYSYKAFILCRSTYFRNMIHILVNIQGLNFYRAGYEYQLIKAGFSRDTNNTIQNIVIIPTAIISCLISSSLEQIGLKKSLIISIGGQLLIYLYLRIDFPLDPYIVLICVFLQNLLQNSRIIIGTMNIYKLPYHSYSGIFTTFLLSTGSFGSSTFLHTKIIAYSNWEIISWIGLILEFLLIPFLYFFDRLEKQWNI